MASAESAGNAYSISVLPPLECPDPPWETAMRYRSNHVSPWPRLGLFLVLALITGSAAADDRDAAPITVDNFVRAETTMQFDRILDLHARRNGSMTG